MRYMIILEKDGTAYLGEETDRLVNESFVEKWLALKAFWSSSLLADFESNIQLHPLAH